MKPTARFALLIPILLDLSLSACAPPMAVRQQGVAGKPPPTTEKAGATETGEQPGVGPGAPKSPAGKTASRSATRSGSADSPAVMALMREADSDSSSGRLDEAAATLERAIRLQPRNAVLWQKLADVRLKQHQPGLAEDLAKKSNVLAQGNRSLVRRNWSIIADARRLKGDVAGAKEADAKAR